MNKHEGAVSLVGELEHWGICPSGYCHCGCGQSTDRYFAPGGDARFSAKLLEALRGNQDVANIIRGLAGPKHS